MPCPDDSGNIYNIHVYGKGVGTRNIMKQSSGEHLYVVLDLPPSFVTVEIQ